MSSFLYRLGRAAYRRRTVVLAAWLAALGVVGAFVGLFAQDFDDEFTLPGSESQEALDDMAMTFPEVSGTTAHVVVVAADGDMVHDQPYRTSIEDAVADIEDLSDVEAATSPFADGADGMIAADDAAALINVQYDGEIAELGDPAENELVEVTERYEADLPDGALVTAGGELFTATGVHVSWVEAVGVGVAFVVLLLTFGSFRAAGMPLANAIWGVAISLLLVLGATAFFDVNSTTPVLALMLGLAVGIDYALFVIFRHREQLGDGLDPEESAGQAVATSGSAVVFAGVTNVIALAGLFVAGIPFLTVMGLAASAAVAIAVLGALTIVPALLGFAGARLRPRRSRTQAPNQKSTQASEQPSGDSSEQTAASDTSVQPGPPKPGMAERFFRGWVRAVTRFPLVTVVVIVVGLGAFVIPATRLELALPNNGNTEENSPARVTYDAIDEHLGPGYNGPLMIKADIIGSDDPVGDLEAMADEVERLDGVETVTMATPNENADTGIIQVIPSYAPDDLRTENLVEQIRDLESHFDDEYGVTTAVTGYTAVGIDVSSQLGGALLPFGILVVGLSLVLLAMVFRSIAVPIKATVGYLLSVVTGFGVVVLVFHDGVFADVLNVAEIGPVISFLPIFLMGVLFGLAMDYEVFLVSRMREDYVHGGNARHAIETGFVSSGPVVTAAAVIMVVVFAAFVPAGEPIVQAIALSLAVGIFVDAFIVRMMLVPAVLTLLRDRAWWIPSWLDRVLPHFDVEGESISRQLSLADWPEPDSPWTIYGEDLGLDIGDQPIFSGADVTAGQGEILVVTGHGTTALLLALSGRAKTNHGLLKVSGYVLPEQAGQLRVRTDHLTMRGSVDISGASPEQLREHATGIARDAQRLRRLPRQHRRVVVVDHADDLPTREHVDAMGELAEVVTRTGAAVLVVGVAHPDRLESLIPAEATTRVVKLEAVRPSPEEAELDEDEPGDEPADTDDTPPTLSIMGGQQ